MAEQEEILAELEKEFDKGYEGIDARPFAVQFPRCTIKAEITNAYLARSTGASGRKQMVATCNIFECSAGDEFEGKTYTKTWGVENEQNLEWLKRDMLALDIVPPKNPKDLIRVMNELMGIKFSAQLVPNREDPEQYPPNMFLNRGARIIEGGSGEKERF